MQSHDLSCDFPRLSAVSPDAAGCGSRYALHRQRRQIRVGSNDACYSDPGRARLIARRKGMVPAPAMRRWVTAEAVQQQSLPRCERRQLGSDGGHGRGGREELLVRLPMALARSPCRSGDNLTRPTRKGVEV